jgi:phosphonate transport system substrate-binding protein
MKIIICLAAVLVLLITQWGTSSKNLAYIDFSEEDSPGSVEISRLQTDEGERPLRVAVCPIISQRNTIESYRVITDYISQKFKRETVLIERVSYSEISSLLANGGADIAFLASGAYTAYTGSEKIETLVTQVRFGVPYYYSYIIVSEDSNVKTLNDLKGKTFAFTDPLSFTGYLAPTHMLRQINQKPESFFRNYTFTYSHEKALKAVANKVIDGAAIGSHVYNNSKENKDGLTEMVKIVATSEKAGIGPVVVRKGLGENQIKVLRNIFLNMHKETKLQAALENLLVDRYVEPEPDLYNYQRSIINEMGTEE